MKQVGVFFGSRSPEHDISIITAMRVLEVFRELPRCRAIAIYIDKRGVWFSGDELSDIAFFRHPNYERQLERHRLDTFSFGDGVLVSHRKRRIIGRAESIRVDMAFPCFHGSFGEDGTIQGVFEVAGMPYVGCGVLASALAISKIHTRRLLREAGITCVPTFEVRREKFEQDRRRLLEEILRFAPFPLFVKPNSLGSSIAVTRVANEDELAWALEIAFQFDTVALVEPAVPHVREINIAVIGHDELTISETEEPQFKSEFQTFEAKYLTKGATISQTKGKTASRIPAELPPELADELKRAAAASFRLLGCSGISRFDFLVDGETKRWYLGEVNTLPGTLHAHLWKASGIPLPQLIEKLLSYAEERHGEERSLMRTFGSSVLQK